MPSVTIESAAGSQGALTRLEDAPATAPIDLSEADAVWSTVALTAFCWWLGLVLTLIGTPCDTIQHELATHRIVTVTLELRNGARKTCVMLSPTPIQRIFPPIISVSRTT
jgi:hypothetical protein